MAVAEAPAVQQALQAGKVAKPAVGPRATWAAAKRAAVLRAIWAVAKLAAVAKATWAAKLAVLAAHKVEALAAEVPAVMAMADAAMRTLVGAAAQVAARGR